MLLLFLLVAWPVRAGDLTVYNTDDDGPGSLRQAVVDAVDGDSITFHSDLYGKTITLTSSGLDITKDLTIAGPGADQLAISGNKQWRVFYIASTLTNSGATIKEGLPTLAAVSTTTTAAA